MQLQIGNVSRCASNNMQAFGLNVLESPQMAVGSMSPNWASVVHHEANELRYSINPFLIDNPLLLGKGKYSSSDIKKIGIKENISY